MASDFEIALEQLAALADLVSGTLLTVGAPAPISAAARLSALTFRSGAQLVRTYSAAELAEIQRQRAVGLAAGGAAYAASRQDFSRRCGSCSSSERSCQLARLISPAARCCPDCSHR